MTLAQVAEPQLTRAAIHLIETGASRPSRRTLELIAARTGMPVSSFLTGPQGESRPEPRPHPSGQGDVLGELQRLIADEEWEPALAEAERVLSAIGNDTLTRAECADLLGLALYRTENSAALSVFNEALRLCRRVPPAPMELEARILGHIGACYTSMHDWPGAINHYQQALAVAGNLRDPGFVERMHNDLGLAETQAGHLAEALQHYQKALALARGRNEPRTMARLENNIGHVLIAMGELDAAQSHLERSLQICDGDGIELGRSHVLCSLAEVCLARRDLAGADTHIRDALTTTQRLGEHLTEADAQVLAGRLSEMRGDSVATDQAFHNALTILADQAATERLVECHAEYAEILEARGNTGAALRHYKQALSLAHPSVQERLTLSAHMSMGARAGDRAS